MDLKEGGLDVEREKAVIGDDEIWYPVVGGAQRAGAECSWYSCSSLRRNDPGTSDRISTERQSNSSESLVTGSCDLRGEDVMREREN